MIRHLVIGYLIQSLLGKHDHELKYVLLLYVIVLFIIVTTFVFSYVILERIRKTYFLKKDALLLAQLEEILPDIMFAEENEQRLLETFKTFNYDYIRKSKRNSETLMTEMLKLYRQFNGEVAQRLKNFYVFSDLIYRSGDKLASRRWHIITMGIHELSEMRIESSYGKIEKHIDSNNVYIREAAQLAILRIKGIKALEGIREVKHIITPWQQMNMMDVAVNFDATQAPDFKNWLYAENFSVIELALKFIVQFQQHHCIEEGAHLLDHFNDKVIYGYLRAIGDTNATGALNKAVKYYDRFSIENKLALLTAIETCGGLEHMDFLAHKLATKNFRIRLAALQAIKKCAGNEMAMQLAESSGDGQLTALAQQLIKND